VSYRPVTDVCLMARPKVPYYGAFPNGSLERMRLPLGALIDDPILFVCSGRVRDYPCRGFGPNDKTVDINPKLKPDFVMDVRHQLPSFHRGREHGWRAMIVDTPYSREEARRYGTEDEYPEPDALLKLCLEHTRAGGRVGVLHWYWPRPPREVHGCAIKEVFAMAVTTCRGSRWRGYVVFEKVAPQRPRGARR